ncbi:MAG: sugar ABC transporter ATP-binding protein, partial [Eubacteriales bacterium]|nr:sugar ABC transporter ATP-binding protein [Eubacteriales bacterium]
RPEYIYEYKNAFEKGIEKNTIGIEETVIVREVLGAEVILYFKLNGKNFSVKLSQETKAYVGENIKLYFDTDKIHIFDKETEQNIFFEKE